MAIDRDQYIAGLRELADRLERNPNCTLPDVGTNYYNKISFYSFDEADFSELVRAIGGNKQIDNIGQIELIRTFGGEDGLQVRSKLLKNVCERKEIGTKTIKKKKALSEPIYEEVEEEVPVYEWECPPSLLKLGDEE